jgi:hypothetical protein
MMELSVSFILWLALAACCAAVLYMLGQISWARIRLLSIPLSLSLSLFLSLYLSLYLFHLFRYLFLSL